MTRANNSRDGEWSQTEAASVSMPRDSVTLLTVQEVALLLKVAISWVYEHTRKRGKARLPHLKLGKYLRFEEQAVREFLGRQRRS